MPSIASYYCYLDNAKTGRCRRGLGTDSLIRRIQSTRNLLPYRKAKIWQGIRQSPNPPEPFRRAG